MKLVNLVKLVNQVNCVQKVNDVARIDDTAVDICVHLKSDLYVCRYCNPEASHKKATSEKDCNLLQSVAIKKKLEASNHSLSCHVSKTTKSKI